MTVLSFSQALRERTWSSHGESEGAGFMSDLMTGKGTRDDYIALVAQHFFVYEALESAAAAFAGDPVAQPFITGQLTRLPALEADLEFLIGDDWRDAIAPVATTDRYVRRIREIVDAEDKRQPLSDDALVEELAKHGYKLARRTITKYRKAMDIPSSRQRREY